MSYYERIEKLKQDFTDKFVVVDGDRPELARFGGFTGKVRTVNMSGRALVEFLDFHTNIGWFDIDLDFLKVIDQPLPKPEPKPAEAKKPAPAAAEKAPSTLEKARAASKPAAPAGKSAADILAAARAGSKPAEAKSAEPKSAESKPAAAKPAESGKKLSPAEMIALARAKSAPAAPAAKPEPAAEPEVAASEPEAAPEPEVSAPSPAAVAVAPKASGAHKKLTSVADMVAWCRANDGKS